MAVLFVLLAANLAFAGRTENVIIMTIDGMRWQEIFNGADSALLNSYYVLLKFAKLWELQHQTRPAGTSSPSDR